MYSICKTLLRTLFLSLALCLYCCKESDDVDMSAQKGEITFNISPVRLSIDESDILSRAGAWRQDDNIMQLQYAILNSRNEVVTTVRHKLKADFSQLRIEGVGHGDYSIVMLATTQPSSKQIGTLNSAHDAWLSTLSSLKAPLNQDYLYAKVYFTVDKTQQPQTLSVRLERCVGRVDLDIKMDNDFLRRFIRKVTISFDGTNQVISSINGLGESVGEDGIISDYDITSSLGFYSFASLRSLSGVVTITSQSSDSTSFVKHYKFSDCTIERGKVTHISIDYVHPESNDGYFHIREVDYSLIQSDTMFMDRESRNVMYNRRSFYVTNPLVFSVTNDGKLAINLFSPIEVKRVKVQCRFRKQSAEFVDFAYFDRIYPFAECKIELPIAKRPQLYTTASGRRIWIPAYEDIKSDDLELRIVSDDPFLGKISEINSNWFIQFSPYGADDGHPYWRHMTPELCRHGVALTLNMAFMFSSDYFNAELDKYDGVLKDDSENAINLSNLRNNLKTHPGLVLGNVVGVGGLGGGQTYGLADYCYRGVYFDATPPGSDPHTYDRMAMFHEYGHCLGYGHSGNMTYGDKWTVLCANVFVHMGENGLLPVNSKNAVGNLPR